MSHITTSTVPHSTAARLLRCSKTKRYFDGGGWTNDPSRAQTFIETIDAALACVTHNLHDVELVLQSSPNGVELFSTPVR